MNQEDRLDKTGLGALELGAPDMSALVDAVMNRVTGFMAGLPHAPVDHSALADTEYLRGLIESVPQQGEAFETLLDQLFDDCLPRSLNATSPGFMGYVPGGGIFHAALADLIADTLNRYVGVSEVAGGFAQLEANVVRWFCAFMGLPEGSAGFLTSGGSLANWSAVVTARENQLGEDFGDGVIYTSNQAHHCVAKAAKLAGIRSGNVRVLSCDERFRLTVTELKAAIDADRRKGLQPFMLVASAGTTNTGAVDPLDALADLAQAEGMWLHVDAAYGGFFRLTERGRLALRGIERADSIALDPHKTMFLPYGTGALLVRDGTDLSKAHASTAEYLPDTGESSDVMDFCDLSPELTRPFRGLRVWLPLKMHGVDVFRQYLDEKLDLAAWLHSELGQIDGLEVVAAPELSILAFAVRVEGADVAIRNQSTRALLQAINARQRVMLTGTLLGDLFVIRVAIVSFRTHQSRLDMLMEDLRDGLEQIRSG